MLLGDVDGALSSFDWYADAYPNDGGEPYQYLTWVLALFRGARRSEAVHMPYQTMLQKVYLVPFLLGQQPRRLDMWHGSNREWPEYATEIPQELLNVWDDVALQWVREVPDHPTVAANVALYVGDPSGVEHKAPRPPDVLPSLGASLRGHASAGDNTTLRRPHPAFKDGPNIVWTNQVASTRA